MEIKFYRCNKCGNIVEMIKDSGAKLSCCEEEMTLLNPNTNEASKEKHIPQYQRIGEEIRVEVGSIIHPHTEEHHIEFVTLISDHVIQTIHLGNTEEPIVVFPMSKEDNVKAVLAYCNLHGLWGKKGL